jgi:hypothetical protein
MRRILNLAERQGFEPWDLLTGVNGFRDRPIRPLWHLSGIGSAKVGSFWKWTSILINCPYSMYKIIAEYGATLAVPA